MTSSDVLIVGAGHCGVASALALKDAGVRSLILERSDSAAAAWRGRYDRLKLNTVRPLSHLPRRPFPKGTPMFPSREDMIEHIERHAAEDGLDFRFRTPVERIARQDGHWALSTPDGELSSSQVIVSTGYLNEPVIPDWEGRDRFRGRFLHSVGYKNPEPFRDERVLVVGPGSSGMEIAHDLATAGATKVWLAVRTPPNILLRVAPGGIPGDILGVAMLHLPIGFADAIARFGRRMSIGDLTEQGLPVPEEGVMSRLKRQGVAPAIVDPEIIDAIKSGQIKVVSAVESFEESEVHLADGSSIEADVVISATGYRCGLEPLVGHLGVLDPRGRPTAVGEQPAAAGLRFIGYIPRPGALGYWAKQAQRAARAIAEELRQTHLQRQH